MFFTETRGSHITELLCSGWGGRPFICLSVTGPYYVCGKKTTKETSDSSGGNKHVLRRKLLMRKGDDNFENHLVPLWLLDSKNLLPPISFKGSQHPSDLASQLGNSEDSWPVEVVLVLERWMKGVRAGGGVSKCAFFSLFFI